ncbi:MAG: hypothetical protein ACKVI4_14025, partial [Actinomycetales bacterium]
NLEWHSGMGAEWRSRCVRVDGSGAPSRVGSLWDAVRARPTGHNQKQLGNARECQRGKGKDGTVVDAQ